MVNDINESSRYYGLVAGKKYKVIVIPVNELGEGGPSWFSDFIPEVLFTTKTLLLHSLDYLERSCHAVPTCNRESVQCSELDAEDFHIVARSVPPRPEFEVATYPSVLNQNRFSKSSLLLTFTSPLIGENGKSSGMPTDKFLVEWSTTSSFLPSTDDSVETIWSSEVTAQYPDDHGEDAIGELLLTSLTMGTQYFVRASAHNSAGGTE